MIERLFQRILQFAFDLVRALVGGILRAPLTAMEQAMPEITVRACRSGEVVDLRHAVLRKGRARETAIWAGDDDPATRHWLAEHDGKVVGIASVMPGASPDGVPDAAWQLRGMAVDEGWQGKGVGRALLRQVVRDVGEPIWANARTTAADFYAKNGWDVVGEPFEIEGVGPHKRIHTTP